MEQHSLSDINLDWRSLMEHVVRDNVVVDVKQDDVTVARISPVPKSVRLSELNEALASIPSLGDDAETFANDLTDIRKSLPAESSPWD